jgi:predicted phosphodiesterase
MSYTVALLADIHGNLAALDAVLADLATQPHDAVVLAGDLLANGPQPAETLRRIQELNCGCFETGSFPRVISPKNPGFQTEQRIVAQVIYGNMDEAIVQATPADPVVWWAQQRIGLTGVAYLETLPFAQRITPPGSDTAGCDLLVVHSTPRSVHDILILQLEPYGTNFTAITPEEDAAEMLSVTRAGLIVYGHIHYFSAGMVRGQPIRSIGSVGFPFDGDRRAAYALLHWDGAAWQVAARRVAYAYEKTVDAIRCSGQPLSERYAQMILQAKWLPRTPYG